MAGDEPQISERTCDNCGVTGEHVLTGDRVVCTNCGSTDDPDLGSCEYVECPNPATHMIVVNPVGEPRLVKYYCGEHAEPAAEGVRESDRRALFFGPLELAVEGE